MLVHLFTQLYDIFVAFSRGYVIIMADEGPSSNFPRDNNMMQAPGPQTLAGLATMKVKYAQPGEDWRAICNRTASAVTDDEEHYRAFRDIQLDMRFIMGGRNLATLGATKLTTPYNCFVSGPVEDSIKSIFQRVSEAALTQQMGGGIGYDFSLIRPRGDTVRSMESRASGPVSFMQVFDAMGRTISSAGNRSGAQMGVLRIDHPDIEEFIRAKQNNDRLNCFNISIAVTDEFMDAVVNDHQFSLRFEDREYRKVNARTLWEAIMRSTWDWAEPGVIFIDRINEMNNLRYCETIYTTNPCSEQPLPPFGACLLGSFNLPRYLRPLSRPSKLDGRYWFDWVQFARDIPVVVQAMDNVIDNARYPLPEQEAEAKLKRRMGLGVMGLANCIEAQGCAYGTPEFISHAEKIMCILKNEAYFASACLADVKGRFPLYSDAILDSTFIKESVSPAVRGRIAQSGLRNSHLTTVAPTGTTAFMADNVSSGIEPVFAMQERRRVKMPDGDEEFDVQDYGVALGIEPRLARDVSPQEHVAVLCAVQKHVDSAVSKTCNVPADTSWDDFKEVYQRAWEEGAKGCATYTVGGKRGSMRAEIKDCEGGACALG